MFEKLLVFIITFYLVLSIIAKSCSASLDFAGASSYYKNKLLLGWEVELDITWLVQLESRGAGPRTIFSCGCHRPDPRNGMGLLASVIGRPLDIARPADSRRWRPQRPVRRDGAPRPGPAGAQKELWGTRFPWRDSRVPSPRDLAEDLSRDGGLSRSPPQATALTNSSARQQATDPARVGGSIPMGADVYRFKAGIL